LVTKLTNKGKAVALHAMRVWCSGGVTPLELGARWLCVVSFTTQPLCCRERGPDSYWVWGSLGPRQSLDVSEENKNLPPLLENTLLV